MLALDNSFRILYCTDCSVQYDVPLPPRKKVPMSTIAALAAAVGIVAHVALNVFTNYLNIVANTEIDFPVVRSSKPLAF